MSQFFEADFHGIVNVKGIFLEDNCDGETLELVQMTIGLLARTVASARTRQAPEDVSRANAFRCVLGLGVLGIGEAQAALLLYSAGLDRSARIHLRSLYEYGIRAKLVSDPVVAAKFLAAAAYEVREIASAIGAQEEDIAAAIAAYALPEDAQPGKETTALGGTMKSIIRSRGGLEEYATCYALPSQVSHGSILALHEVSRAIAGHAEDFPQASVTDGTGNFGLLRAAVHVHTLIGVLRAVCDIGTIAAPLYDLLRRVQAIRVRLGLMDDPDECGPEDASPEAV